MIACLDVQAGVAQRAGVGRYVRALSEHLGAQAGRDRLALFWFDFRGRAQAPASPGARSRTVRWCPGRVAQAAWKTLRWPPFDWFSGPADVFHFPNFVRPPLSRGASVTTIHDLAFLRYPDTLEERNYRYLTSRIHDTILRSDALIAVSKFTAFELQEWLGVPKEKITVIYEGLEPSWAAPDSTRIHEVRNRHKLDGPYLLTVGTIEPRKNIPFLVDVFERLNEFDGTLIVAGRAGWKCEEILDRMRKSPRAPRIRHLHNVADRDLPALYAGAELFVFPSLYEGFGFPPLEAMACGTPVLAAAVGSLPEILGDAAELTEGHVAEVWAQTITRLLGDSARREELCIRGRMRARAFTWDDTAKKTWELYRRVARR